MIYDTAAALEAARRALDRAQSALQDKILKNTSPDERHAIPALMDLYYSTDHAKTFNRRARAWYDKTTPSALSLGAEILAVQNAFKVRDEARAAEKVGKVQRKAERAAKAADRKALRGNKAPAHVPREVFDLSRKTLRDAIQPQFEEYKQQIFLHLFNRADRLLERLEKCNGDALAAAAHPKTWDEIHFSDQRGMFQRMAEENTRAVYNEIKRWSTRNDPKKQPQTHQKGATDFRTRRPAHEIEAELMKEAHGITEHDFDTYSIKLAGKIALPVESATITGKLWNYSFLVARIESGFWNGSERQPFQRWKTQMILNTSVLGKLFNQWPTRRVA